MESTQSSSTPNVSPSLAKSQATNADPGVSILDRLRAKRQSPDREPPSKILWSTLGGFIGILCIASLNRLTPFPQPAITWLVASFGASAVLVFSFPQNDFSQPRNLIGGHLVCAVVGVSVHRWIGDQPQLAAATAVAVSIAIMHWTRTLHPPGGGTALTAVAGGTAIQTLGYHFVLTPVLAGSVLLVIIALVVNNLSSDRQRHYPHYWV